MRNKPLKFSGTKGLLIKQCTISMAWYSDMIGKTVPFLRECCDCYKALEPSGRSNIVAKEDAEIVDL